MITPFLFPTPQIPANENFQTILEPNNTLHGYQPKKDKLSARETIAAWREECETSQQSALQKAALPKDIISLIMTYLKTKPMFVFGMEEWRTHLTHLEPGDVTLPSTVLFSTNTTKEYGTMAPTLPFKDYLFTDLAETNLPVMDSCSLIFDPGFRLDANLLYELRMNNGDNQTQTVIPRHHLFSNRSSQPHWFLVINQPKTSMIQDLTIKIGDAIDSEIVEVVTYLTDENIAVSASDENYSWISRKGLLGQKNNITECPIEEISN